MSLSFVDVHIGLSCVLECISVIRHDSVMSPSVVYGSVSISLMKSSDSLIGLFLQTKKNRIKTTIMINIETTIPTDIPTVIPFPLFASWIFSVSSIFWSLALAYNEGIETIDDVVIVLLSIFDVILFGSNCWELENTIVCVNLLVFEIELESVYLDVSVYLNDSEYMLEDDK